LVLSFSGSLQVWARVYFYGVLAAVAPMAIFATPAKQMLRKKLEARAGGRGKMVRSTSQDSVAGQEPILGLSDDPQREIAEIVEELKADTKAKGQ